MKHIFNRYWWETRKLQKYLREGESNAKRGYEKFGDKFVKFLVDYLVKKSTTWDDRKRIVDMLNQLAWKPTEGYPEETFYNILNGRWQQIVRAAQNAQTAENQIWPLIQCYNGHWASQVDGINKALINIARMGSDQCFKVIKNLLLTHPSKILSEDTFMLFAYIGVKEVCNALDLINEKGEYAGIGAKQRDLARYVVNMFLDHEKHKVDVLKKIRDKAGKPFTIVSNSGYKMTIKEVVSVDENYVTFETMYNLGGEKNKKMLLSNIDSIE